MHVPVMGAETLALLQVRAGGVYVDGTVGGGGHAYLILAQAGTHGRLLGIDRDDEALKWAARKLARFGACCRLAHGNFAGLADLAAQHGIAQADGILLDLGVSSRQLDVAERGFSFMRDGPLDMRMDRRQSLMAMELVNTWNVTELTALLRRYGEEPHALRIARAIVRYRTQRPLQTTGELASLVERTLGGRRGARHPATRSFQALRIAVNEELEALADGFEAAVQLLAPGGRLAVLSYHSLEDRLVKRLARAHVGRMVSLPAGGEQWEGILPALRWITKRPLTPGTQELASNPRARAAKLRVVERVTKSHGETKTAS